MITSYKHSEKKRKDGFEQWDNVGTRTHGSEPATYKFTMNLMIISTHQLCSGTDFQTETVAAKEA